MIFVLKPMRYIFSWGGSEASLEILKGKTQMWKPLRTSAASEMTCKPPRETQILESGKGVYLEKLEVRV